MRVALDGTPLTSATGGIRRYTSELSRALATEFPEDQYWLVSDQPLPAPEPDPPNLLLGRPPRNRLTRKWWSLGVLAESHRIRVDVFHGTDYATPYVAALPSVLTLHDISPWRSPAWGASPRVRRRTPVLLGLGLATMVITPSESVRRDAAEWFRLPLARIVAIPLASAPRFRPQAPPPRNRPYLLYVGALEPRKNIPLILEAWREVGRRHAVDLVLAGERRADFPALAEQPGLTVMREVPDTDLPALYSGAAAFLYPSFYEGFGLPVLEAMACGAPVVTSADAALREIGGDAAVQLDAADSAAWVEALDAILSRPDWRQQLIERSKCRASMYSWARAARATREVYLEARQRFGG